MTKKIISLIIPICIISLIITFSILNAQDEQFGLRIFQVGQGGTGASTFTSGECLVGNGTGAITTTACGGAGGGGAAWEFDATNNAITPTTTNANIYVDGNSTTTGSVAITSITGLTQCLEVDTNGLVSGTGSACGAGGGASAGDMWTAITDSIYHNTTTDTVLIGKNSLADGTRALEVNGTSYFDGNATTTGWFYIGQDLTVAGNVNANVIGSLTGNADTATALAANGGNCSAGSYPLGVNDLGAVESCTDATTEIDSAILTHKNINDAHQDLVTLTGEGYITISGQVLTLAKLDIAETNLTVSSPITLSTNDIGFDFTTVNTWSGINTFTSDLRATGGLHASTTDFDSLMVNGNATTTGAMYVGADLTVAGHSEFATADFSGAVTGIALNEIENPEASKTFALGNNKTLSFTSVDTTPSAGEGVFNWQAGGAFSGDLLHVHQHTGNPGYAYLLHLEAEDTDVIPLVIGGIASTTMILGYGSGEPPANGVAFNINPDGDLTLAPRGTATTTNIDMNFKVDGSATTTVLYVTESITFPNPANCASGEYALGIDGSGVVESCTDATTEIDSIVATHLTVVADTSTTGHLNDTDWDTFNNKFGALTDITLTNNQIFVGNASNNPVSVAMSSDCTIVASGAITCDHDALDNFLATEHVDWAGASAGTIHTDNYIEYADSLVASYIVGSSTVINLICPNGEIAKSSGSAWACAADDDSGGFSSNWIFGTDESYILPSSTAHTIGFLVNASSTVAADFTVEGNATTTGSHFIGKLRADNPFQFTTAGNNFIYFDNALTNYIQWDDSADYFYISNDLSVNGTASSTAIRVNDAFVVDSVGNATSTGNVVIGEDGALGSKKGCIAIRGEAEWGFGYWDDNADDMTWSTTSCVDTGANATSTIILGQ